MLEDKIKKFNNYIQNNNFEFNLNDNKIHEIFEDRYIIDIYNYMNTNNYHFNKNKKILVIIATHISDTNKFDIIKNNTKYFKEHDIIINNSSGLNLNEEIKTYCENEKIIYQESDNDIYLDFGKWYKTLNTIDYNKYDYIVFTNDSIYITYNINHFFNLMVDKNVELYGYNDSSEINYHYQSYLFGIKNISIKKFINFFEENKRFINCTNDVISNTELKLANTFISKDCFLHLIDFKSSQNKNIYYCNNNLYKKLYLHNLLPIIKLKKLYEI